MQDGFRLITLGRLALLSPNGREDPSLAARRLKLVLLAVLASARRPMSRDSLLALFWPEQEEARARHSLSDALSHLRRVLGTGAISTRKAEVVLTPQAALSTDAAEFVVGIQSADAKRFERALALYEGPFLSGVNLSASQQLDEWIARERASLETLFARACERRCAELARDGNWEECASLSARWLDAVPLSTDAAVHRLTALNAPGTRDSAQRTAAEYRRMVARLREEFGRGPDARVVEIARGLRPLLGGVSAEEAEAAIEDEESTIETSRERSTEATSVASDDVSHAPISADERVERGSAIENEEGPRLGAATGNVKRLPRRWVYGAVAAVAVLAAVGARRVYAHRVGVGTALASSPIGPAPPNGDLANGIERVLVADLANHTRDSLLPGAITEALRVDLEQSRRVQVLSTPQVQEALRLMERPLATPLSDSVAREVAMRDGAKALITGDVGELGIAYTISVHLVSAQSGEIVDALRETAKDSTQVLDAVDRLSRQLRTRLGDGLALIQSSAPLERVTTSSLSALRAYSEGMRASERDGNAERSIALLEEAVSLDPHFAMAYRKLGAEEDLLGYARHAKALEATANAFRNRDHLSDRERYLTMGLYYQNTGETGKAIAAYRAVLEEYPRDIHALNNLGSIDMNLKNFVEAAVLRGRALAVDSTIPDLYNNFAQALFCEGKYEETAQVVHTLRRRFPAFAPGVWTEISLVAARGELDSAAVEARAALTLAGDDYDARAEALAISSAIALVQGRIRQAEQTTREMIDLVERRGQPADYLEQIGFLSFIDTWYHHAPTRALARLDSALARYPLAKMPPEERHADWLAYNYAIAGNPARARVILDGYENSHPVYGIGDLGTTERARGAIELAEHRYADAQSTLRKSQADYWCPTCSYPDLGRAYESGGQLDSAAAAYSRYVNTPWVWWLRSDGEYHAWAYQRMGELYESRADTARAVAAYRSALGLWSHADPELEPALSTMRARLDALGGRIR